MKINNRLETSIMMYGFLIIILLDILFLAVANKTFEKSPLLLSVGLVIALLSVWRIATLKIFSVEVSEHIISVKYRHPFLQNRQPVL